MTKYECLSLGLTAIYDILTFLLLIFVIYEAIIKSRLPNIAFYLQNLPDDTKNWPIRRQLADFILENRGPEIKNVTITSNPDNIGWDNLGANESILPRRTSEYFKKPIPFLGRNERHQFFWCDLEQNIEVLKKPFKIIIEFDNPAFPIPRRRRKIFEFDFSVFDGVAWGVTGRFDIHNVAQESERIRAELERIGRSIGEINQLLGKWEKSSQDAHPTATPDPLRRKI